MCGERCTLVTSENRRPLHAEMGLGGPELGFKLQAHLHLRITCAKWRACTVLSSALDAKYKHAGVVCSPTRSTRESLLQGLR
eukprot:1899003-Pyramimonas_sp.AAC.1